jgi:hypothetical protein
MENEQSSSIMEDGQEIPSQIITKDNEGVVSASVLPLRRMIVFGVDGVPRPANVPLLNKQSIEDLAITALSLPYMPDPLSLTETEEFLGMSNAEVMIVKLARAAAAGSMQATETLLDRVLGRPKQSLESKSMTMTYADVLKEKAARAEAVDVLVEVARRTPDNPFSDPMDGLV